DRRDGRRLVPSQPRRDPEGPGRLDEDDHAEPVDVERQGRRQDPAAGQEPYVTAPPTASVPQSRDGVGALGRRRGPVPAWAPAKNPPPGASPLSYATPVKRLADLTVEDLIGSPVWRYEGGTGAEALVAPSARQSLSQLDDEIFLAATE